jgi:hypothetical protein
LSKVHRAAGEGSAREEDDRNQEDPHGVTVIMKWGGLALLPCSMIDLAANDLRP